VKTSTFLPREKASRGVRPESGLPFGEGGKNINSINRASQMGRKNGGFGPTRGAEKNSIEEGGEKGWAVRTLSKTRDESL